MANEHDVRDQSNIDVVLPINDRIRGFHFDTLNSMVYNDFFSNDDVNDLNNHNLNVQCNYKLPKDMTKVNQSGY